ncbi:hypothetical protein LRAMOSA00290 [Lichtheimia ramosa]|uniref:Uncharacterized protein n=1 Tax=Lichtheimia ramosa TaxID=688394 RepID=A0A077W9V8_9FUNG|nr:hypothetical protein LRAMOSA00290 [Lichtheimia ramosa]
MEPTPDADQQREALKNLQRMTQSLIDCKANLLQKTESLEHKQHLLEEVISERQRLTKEKRMLLDMIQNVQRDLEATTEAEASLLKERDDLQQTVDRVRNQEYEPLHDRVNQLRTSHGLQKVPHVQQEVDAQMARILEERRTNWQQQGTSPAVSSSNHSSGTRSRRRGGGRG